ncbi:hypothetical protein BS47DRAFT_1344486 [Hydnum rufescens UP504]|uniref:HIG1 domain-containing protein n=1 Tax=Hydnum rufescens UP504 TaxID=1448309 RepID=A0A9P6DWX9_9AGAM|nr:hypothetical protein BS47DRAFT_1344486 [Hydnum rufescens UP504]
MDCVLHLWPRHYRIVLRGGLKGFAASSAVTVPLSVYLHRAWPYYRALPLSLKALGVITITIPACVVKAELDGNAWERARWRDAGKMEMEQLERLEQERVAQLSSKEKVMNWAAERRYSIVGASWALSMAIAFGVVMRNPYQTFPQKIVQARMWAQGLTVGVLVASAGLATTESPRHARVDHSWAAILEEQAREREARSAQSNPK